MISYIMVTRHVHSNAINENLYSNKNSKKENVEAKDSSNYQADTACQITDMILFVNSKSWSLEMNNTDNFTKFCCELQVVSER